jgi:hypothetical protein
VNVREKLLELGWAEVGKLALILVRSVVVLWLPSDADLAAPPQRPQAHICSVGESMFYALGACGLGCNQKVTPPYSKAVRGLVAIRSKESSLVYRDIGRCFLDLDVRRFAGPDPNADISRHCGS